MKGIRPFTREDIAQVASLYELVIRSKTRQAPPALGNYFERIFFENPWIDPEIPSLVFEDKDGTISGFVGSHVRRMRFDGKAIRVGVCSQLIADPEVRSQAVGAFLMRKYMTGPQDLSLMETCSDGMRLIWENLGGQTVHLNCLNYTRFFKPLRFAANQVINRGKLRPIRGLLRATADALDVPASRIKSLKLEDKGMGADDLTPESYLEHLPAIAGKRRLVPNYDLDFLRWQWFEMAQVKSKGDLHGSLVRDEKSQVVGWYLYQVTPGDKGHIIQVEAKRGFEDEALAQLFSDAKHRGATLLHGRMEPNLHVPLVRENRCWLHSRYDRTLIYSRNPEILRAYYSGDAIFTRMEGEFWMGFHLEPFEQAVQNPYTVRSEVAVTA
jgi:hypothetical protein